MDNKRNKHVGTRIPMSDVMRELDLVPWPPKVEGDYCPCGCNIKDGRFDMCAEHQPRPA